MKQIFTLLLLFYSMLSFSQSKINGLVTDTKGTPIFAANIYSKSNPQNGVISDFNGNFSLPIKNISDSVIISFIGYKEKILALKNITIKRKIVVVLEDAAQALEEVIITAKDPISEQFTVTKMEKLKDVYLNPASQGDFLKAITVLPASSNTEETANPSLRGSSPDRSRVVLNGVPIYKPTKSNMINNSGFFSLFNPEVIDKQYVYASNPPLTYGNASAGLVEIQTVNNLHANQVQISASLASTGLFLSQSIKKNISFIQLYGNYQFSNAFVGIQKDKLPNIKDFYTKDLGINFHSKIGKGIEFNTFNYFIDENFSGYSQAFTYQGSTESENKRFFTVNNLKYYTKKGILSVNLGADNSKQNFKFGNINSTQKSRQIYSSIDYKWNVMENIKLQFGLSHDYQRNNFEDSIPIYYFAISSNSANYYSQTSIHNHILEAYLYSNWEINENFTLSSGIRRNYPVKNQKYYFSSQFSLKYKLNSRQDLLLSGGKYHNYSIPNYYSKTYNLLTAKQIAMDYSHELTNTLIKMAAYFKNETGEQSINNFFTINRVNTLGLELYFEHNFWHYLKFSFANSFIDQKIKISDSNYHGAKDLDYFIKSTIQYSNPRLFSIAITYTSRPGTYYNEIISSKFHQPSNFYEPMFSENLYGSQFGSYNRFDISISKYIQLNKNAIIAFFSANNIFNTKNEKAVLYNKDYSDKYFDYSQLRIFYWGLVWQINY